MLDGVGLIHMAGRVYDPTVGRFLSVDPLVRDAAASQSWNGYGYVEGRVLSATDPSGWQTVDCPQCVRYRADPPRSAMEVVVVTARRWDPLSINLDRLGLLDLSRGLSRAEMPSQTVNEEAEKEEPQGEPCTADGTVTGFLAQHGAEIVDRTFSVFGGVGQVALGATICSGVASCAGGAVLAAHGVSNVYEGVTGASSLLRDGYHAVLGSVGDAAYSLANIGTSVYGMTRSVLRPDAWSLFRNVSSDCVPAFRTMTGTELVTEGAGIINDGLRAAGVAAHTCKGP
jgi:RHS repeat-associated protein